MIKEIQALRKKLPNRGYVKAILEAEREIIGKGKKLRISEDEIKNFFTRRAVSSESKLHIINASKKAIENAKKAERELKALATAQ